MKLNVMFACSSGYGRFGNVRENLQLSKQHFTPFVLYKNGAVDDMIRGLASQSSQKFDRYFTKEVCAVLTYFVLRNFLGGKVLMPLR